MNLRHIRCLAIVAFAATTSAAQTTNIINVTDSRPLNGAIDALESVIAQPINYEDPPYENVADVQAVSTPQLQAGRPGFQILVPRIGNVAASVQIPAPNANSESDAIFDLNLLLVSYQQNSLPGAFKVEEANGMIYVTPTEVMGANGVTRQVSSPMTVPVTVPYAKRTVAATVRAILTAVSGATGFSFGIGSLPFWPTDVVSFSASAEPARDSLARLFAQTATGPMSYRLLFTPRPNKTRPFDYVINFHRPGSTPPNAPAGLGPVTGKQVQSAQPTGKRPGQP
jgi:hypothetical protein